MGSPIPSMTAQVKCSFGIAPMPTVVLPTKMTIMGNQVPMDLNDFKPFVNIMPFGMCISMANPSVAAKFGAPSPCTPMTSAPWVPPNPKCLVKNMPVIQSSSMCICAFAGIINIIAPGQFKVMA